MNTNLDTCAVSKLDILGSQGTQQNGSPLSLSFPSLPGYSSSTSRVVKVKSPVFGGNISLVGFIGVIGIIIYLDGNDN